jgi:hypothetical protein
MTRVVAGIKNSNGLLDELPKQNANPLNTTKRIRNIRG